MKKYQLLFSLLITFFLSVTVSAQCQPQLICLAENEATQAASQIGVQIPAGSLITKIRLNSENSGKSDLQNVSAGKTVFLPVELADGVNSFNIIAYTDNKIVFSTASPIVINRIKAAENALPNPKRERIAASSDGLSSNEPRSGNLKLFGKSAITNQTVYNLQIDAASMPAQVGEYVIEIANVEKTGASVITDSEIRPIVHNLKNNRQENVQVVQINLREGANTVTVYPKVNGQELRNFAAVKENINCLNCIDKGTTGQSVNVRSIIGFEQVGASSASNKQSPFLNFFFNTPINVRNRKINCLKEPEKCFGGKPIVTEPRFRFSVWGDIRLTTTPVQSIAALSDFSTLNFATNFVQGDNASKVNDLVQSFNFLVGVEKQIIPPGEVFPSFFSARTSLSLVAAGGAINPLSSEKNAAIFKIPLVNNVVDPRFLEAFPEASGKTNVAFVTPERDRFFRQYYAGFRLKTFFYDGERQRETFPAMFDVMFGQNEAITNRLQGVIMRLDGSTPFPVKSADFLYLFGSAQLKLGRTVNQTIPSFFLEAAASSTTLTSADTVAIPINRSPFLRSNRDVFRVGVGVDLIKLFSKDEKP